MTAPRLHATRPAGTSSPRHWLSTLCWALLAVWLGWQLFDWGVRQAVFSPDLPACHALQHRGACWGVVTEKGPQWLLGRYPHAERWRPALALLWFLGGLAGLGWALATGRGRHVFNSAVLVGALIALGGVPLALLRGGWLGLPAVPVAEWGGLPLTLLVATVTLLGSLPLAALWALGRQRGPRMLRWACTLCIETLRGAPLVMWLFMAAFMLPALWGPEVEVGLLARVLMVTVPFSAAYMAEIFRGALAAVHGAQEEAAATLGASRWQVQWRVVAPQAWQVALPALTGHAIGVLKDTALITVVGLHELNGSMGLSLNGDADWRPFFLEAYLAVGSLYLAMGLALSALGRRLEAQSPGAGWRD
jgi:general L-amino acid transport system permease protein